jgi:hypothetical protein
VSLLSNKPDLITVNNLIAGGDLIDCLSNANTYPSYFDESYVSSKNRLSSFALFGQPTVSLSDTALSWAYDSTAVKSFVVTCNHSTWKFTSSSVTTGFSVSVYDSTNTTYLGGLSGTYPSGCYVRVAPNSQNLGSSDKVCYLYCGTYNDYNVAGGEFTGTQRWNCPPPDLDVACVDGTMTLSGIDHELNIGDTELWLQFIPDNLDPAPVPKVGDTIYIDVQRSGPIGIASTSITHCFNGVTKSLWITLNEAALGNTTYYVRLSTDNN